MRMPWSGDKENKTPKKHQSVIDLLFLRAKMHWWLFALLFILVTLWAAFPMEESRRLVNPDDFKVGEKSQRDVFAQLDVAYYDEIATEKEKQKSLTNVPPVFNLDFQRLADAEEEFNWVRLARADYTQTDEEKIAAMKRRFIIGPSDNVGLILATASDEQLDVIEKAVIRVLSDILAEGVVAAGNGGSFVEQTLLKIDYIKPKWERIKERLEEQTGQATTDVQIAARIRVSLLDARSTPPVEKEIFVEELRVWSEATNAARDMAKEMPEPISTVVKEMAVDLMRPNLEYNAVLTRKRQEDLLSSFPPVGQTISRGDKIIGFGEVITEYTRGKLETISSEQKQAIMRAIPGAVLLAALLACVLVIYLKKYEPTIFSEPRKIVSLNIVILLVLVLEYFAIVFLPALKIERPGFLVPAALVPIVVAILTNVQLAIIVTCVTGALVAMLAGVELATSLQYFLVILAGGLVAAISAPRARHRRHLMITGVYVAVANVVTILGLGLLTNTSFANLGTNCLMGVVNGIIVSVLAPGLLPIFEYLSRTTTDMELLELADLNQPLLIDLKRKASGSYYHSLAVGQLAETAAEAIGANALLARVGSYYHDIGKVAKPQSFIENQQGENVHDTLNPSMSARVIASHVKEGTRLAKEHKLPQIVVDIVQQHHGNTLIGGQRFYQRAMEADRHNTVRPEDYRYPGPKPQTKEAAVVLLADSVESARHAMLNGSPTYSRLGNFVKEIVESKTMDFQLNECDLTLRDINLIADAFVKVLSGMYHTRIEYPKAAEVEPVGVKSIATEGQNGGEGR